MTISNSFETFAKEATEYQKAFNDPFMGRNQCIR